MCQGAKQLYSLSGFHRYNDMCIGRIRPHDPGAAVQMIGGNILKHTMVGNRHHQVRSEICNPIRFSCRFGSVRIGVTDRSIALEHVSEPDLRVRRLLLLHIGPEKIELGLINTPRVIAWRILPVGQAGPAVLSFTQYVEIPVHYRCLVRDGCRSGAHCALDTLVSKGAGAHKNSCKQKPFTVYIPN